MADPSAGGGAAAGGDEGAAPSSIWDSLKYMVGLGETEEQRAATGKAAPQPVLFGRGVKDTVLVTGAEGYLAGHVIKTLLERDYTVIGTVRSLRNAAKHAHLQTLCPRIQKANPNQLELVEADLSRPGSFDRHVKRCEFVIHCAAPFRLSVRDATVGLLNPATLGTQSLLTACQKSGTVRRVVMTSCCVALVDKPEKKKVYSELDWNATSSLDHYPYFYAKTQQEKKAFEFWNNIPAKGKFELISLVPGVMLGPLVNMDSTSCSTSVRLFLDQSKGALPAIPKIGLPVVDVRDVAEAHVMCLKNPKANGRYILTADRTIQFKAAVEIMRPLMPGNRFPKKVKGKRACRTNEIFQRNIPFKYIRPWLGRDILFNNQRAVQELGVSFRPVDKTIGDMAVSLASAK